MRLTKIKLSGFKSFVDPTTITFPSNLIGIVGPNGCGKSNVIDAIRWVLGESSAKTLRGDSMADVIFNGSGGRKPVGQASIELVFDNSDGTIGGPYAGYSDLAVKRIVSRDGTSQYYLNNARCRRKDITHILLGTGLGSHGYSIIEQGMISRLVEAKPEELRAFLEEAAGISKYKERRRETGHRIRHTRENLERLSDLREEVDKQIAHLQRQARTAERYKKLKADQRRIGAELLALRLSSLQQEGREREQALNAKQTALDAALAEQRALESAIEKLRVELDEQNDQFNRVQGDYYKVGAEIARLEQSIQHRKELGQRQHEDLAATDVQLDEIKAHIANDQVKIEEIDRLLEELSPGLAEAHDSQEASMQALEQAEQAMERWRERRDELSRVLAETEATVHVEATRLEQLSAQRDRLDGERDKLVTERASLRVDTLEGQLDELISDEESLKGGCEAATRALDSLWQQIQTLRAQDRQVAEGLNEARGKLQSDRGRLSSLEALQEAALGKNALGVSGWLEAHGLSGKPRLAQRLKVEPGWERAVETVLGAYLQAVCVKGIHEVVERLGDLSEGGLMLLESDRTGAALVATRGEQLLERVEGPAAVKTLLAGVRTAGSLRKAVALRERLGPGESVITKDGFWLSPHWLRINREDDPQAGVLGRGEEINALQKAVQAGARRVEEIESTLADTQRRLEEFEAEHARAQTETSDRQRAHGEAKSRLESCRTRLEQLQEQAASLDRALVDREAETRSLTAALQESERRLSTAQDRRKELARQQSELEAQRAEREAELAKARERADQNRELAKEMAIKVESRRSSKESATAALQRVSEQREHLLKRRRELEAQLAGAAAPLEADGRALEQHLDQRLNVENKLAAARRALEETDSRLREVHQQRTDKENAISAARENVEAMRLNVRETQVRADTVTEQLRETGFDLETLVNELPEDATTEVWEESFANVERRIQRLGAINLAAIDEYEEQSERKKYLDAQFEDLTEALQTLENAIRKIDRETRSRFKETFDEANAGLNRLFPRLFGGGQAYLELEGDDLLSSGVTVMARPPGKRISTIHLLSGGEKALTAVALVFSIFELNPAPFCLLDEVDAPLDDANVGRFSEIVKEMSQHIQFVIITHNKTTMEVMHQLIGVTMNEPGVSRLVAVDIDEAVKLAAM